VKIVVNILLVGAPAMMTANRHLTEQGWMSPPAGHRHCSGEFLLCDIACLGLLLHRDTDLYPLTGLGLLSWMR
jgi:hypothetical protein